jgi:hypothetical protein
MSADTAAKVAARLAAASRGQQRCWAGAASLASFASLELDFRF